MTNERHIPVTVDQPKRKQKNVRTRRPSMPHAKMEQATTPTARPSRSSSRIATPPRTPDVSQRSRVILWTAVIVTMVIIIVGWVQVVGMRFQGISVESKDSEEASIVRQLRDEFAQTLESFAGLLQNEEANAGYSPEVEEIQNRVFPQFDTSEN